MENKKKVLFIIWSFSAGGGAEKILSNLICASNEYLKADILEVEHFDKGFEKYPADAKILPPIYDNTKNDLRCLVKASKRFVQFFSPKLFRLICRKTHDYDYVISFNYAVPSLLLFPNEKSVCWIHGSIEELKDSPRWKKRQHNVFKAANAIVAISENTKKSITELYPEFEKKVCLIYNGYNFSDIFNLSKKPITDNLPNKFIVYIGRLDENKNPLRVLDVYKNHIHPTHQDTHLIYIGHGKLENDLASQIKKYGLNSNVHLLGFRKNPYPILGKAKCLLCLSKTEGFPTILIESLALEVPFVSSPVAGTKEISKSGTLSKIVNTDEEAGIQVCRYLNSELSENEKKEMREHAMSFSAENQAEKLYSLLREIEATDSI